MSLSSLFPTKVWQRSLVNSRNRLISELKTDAYLIKKSDIEGLEWSKKNYRRGYTSYGSLSQLHQFNTTFEELSRLIELEVREYLKSLEFDIKPHELTLTRMWVNIMGPGCYHTMHLHPLSVISGTFYVSMPAGASALRFEDPRHSLMMASPPRKQKAHQSNQNFIEQRAKPGDLILFESWLRHEVPESKIKEDRISISFNFDWI